METNTDTIYKIISRVTVFPFKNTKSVLPLVTKSDRIIIGNTITGAISEAFFITKKKTTLKTKHHFVPVFG